jgi:hypothetical protein
MKTGLQVLQAVKEGNEKESTERKIEMRKSKAPSFLGLPEFYF